jgi:hypothetical protein
MSEFIYNPDETQSVQVTSNPGAAPVNVALSKNSVAYDPTDDMFKIKSLQKKFRDSFVGSSIDATKWDSVTGTGATNTVAAGVLTMASGTTINADSYLLSKDVFTVPFRLSIGIGFSQRIVNQNFFVEAVSVDPITGVPDEKNIIGFLFDGVTATQAKYRVKNGGMTPLDSAATTIPTTTLTSSLPVSVYEIEPFADEAWFHGSTIDSTNARSNSYRRHQQIPDPNALYKLRLRWINGATAPASSTNAVVQFVACQDYAELTAEITAGRGQAVAGQAIGVQVTGGTLAISGNTAVAGAVAHDGAVSGNPVRIGAKAVNVYPAAVSATNDAIDLITTMNGALITKPYAIPEADWTYACPAPIAVNTDTVVKAAAAAGVRNYVTNIQIANSHATVGTEVVLKDGATVIWRGYLKPNNDMTDITFYTPLRGTAATAVNFQCLTAGASVYVNVQGYIAP